MEKKEPIRVLHVNGKMISGGVESFIMNVYRNIDRTKVQFDFLIHYQSRHVYDDEIESLGGKIYRLSFRDDKNFFKYKKDLELFFNTHKYSIVHGHMSSMGRFYLSAAKKAGVPTRIAHSHIANNDSTLKGMIKTTLERKFSKYSTVNFACSELAGQFMFKKSPFTVVNNAIDLEKFQYNSEKRTLIRKQLMVSDETFLIGHVGRYSRQKNHNFIIDLAKQFKEMNAKIKFVLIGSGELEINIKNEIKKQNLHDFFILTGSVNNVSDFYSAMDVFILPSYYEGLPVSGIEAQMNGLPCLFSEHITREVKRSESCFFLPIKKRSIDDWTKKIMFMKQNSVDRKIVNEQLCEFDIIKIAKRLENFYLNGKYE